MIARSFPRGTRRDSEDERPEDLDLVLRLRRRNVRPVLLAPEAATSARAYGVASRRDGAPGRPRRGASRKRRAAADVAVSRGRASVLGALLGAATLSTSFLLAGSFSRWNTTWAWPVGFGLLEESLRIALLLALPASLGLSVRLAGLSAGAVHGFGELALWLALFPPPWGRWVRAERLFAVAFHTVMGGCEGASIRRGWRRRLVLFPALHAGINLLFYFSSVLT